MKRIKIAIAIMAVVLIASLGIYFLADHLNSNKTKKKLKRPISSYFLILMKIHIDKVDIHNESGNYTAEYIDSNWQLTNTDEFDLNSTAITAICSNFCNLTAIKILDDNDSSNMALTILSH